MGTQVPGDSVALSFWYQSGGIANGADSDEDSLIVEFRTSIADGDPEWVGLRRALTTIRCSNLLSFQSMPQSTSTFQFRFRNYGSLEGNVDTWHIDFVRVAENGVCQHRCLKLLL